MSESTLVPLLIGESSFAILRETGAYYFDKTATIKEILNDGNSVSLVTRPRRFGKTLLQRTLQCFLELNYLDSEDFQRVHNWFKGLAITKDADFCEANMGRWPVVFLSLKEVDAQTFDVAVSDLSNIVSASAKTFEFLLQTDRLQNSSRADLKKLIDLPNLSSFVQSTTLAHCLKQLTQILHEAFSRRVIVLVDEYDVPLNRARVNGYYQTMQPLLKKMLGGAMKDNPALQKGIITGCLRIAKESVFTDFNNFACHSISDLELSDAVGFTSEEANKILADFKLTKFSDRVRHHYDGYRFGEKEIYCPWDLLSFCRDNREIPSDKVNFKNYWIHTSSNSLITEFLHFADESHLVLLKQLLKGNSVRASVSEDLSFAEINSSHSPQHLLSLLYCTGYLTAAEPIGSDGSCLLRIPNEEVRLCFTREIEAFFSDQGQDYVNTGRELMQKFILGKGAAANSIFADILMRNISVRDTGSESFYHGLLLGLLSSARSQPIESNRESGDGYFDIRFYDKASDTAVLIELKQTKYPTELSAAAKEAVAQIHARHYYADFLDSGISHIRLYGIACCGKYCRTVKETLSEEP